MSELADEKRHFMKWQPMIEAPKDRKILAWVDWLDSPGCEIGTISSGLFWMMNRSIQMSMLAGWMPLPVAPGSANQSLAAQEKK
jgi:hypothetical protein